MHPDVPLLWKSGHRRDQASRRLTRTRTSHRMSLVPLFALCSGAKCWAFRRDFIADGPSPLTSCMGHSGRSGKLSNLNTYQKIPSRPMNTTQGCFVMSAANFIEEAIAKRRRRLAVVEGTHDVSLFLVHSHGLRHHQSVSSPCSGITAAIDQPHLSRPIGMFTVASARTGARRSRPHGSTGTKVISSTAACRRARRGSRRCCRRAPSSR